MDNCVLKRQVPPVTSGVDADDVVRSSEARGVLHRAADPEGDVQPRIDDHPGGADLTLVAEPAAIGDDPRGSDACTQDSTERAERNMRA